jgi:hypothetical protein
VKFVFTSFISGYRAFPVFLLPRIKQDFIRRFDLLSPAGAP